MALAARNLALVLSFLLYTFSYALSPNYYDQTCPEAEAVITNVVKKGMMNDKTVPAALLRMHFHDCFIRVVYFSLYNVFFGCSVY